MDKLAKTVLFLSSACILAASCNWLDVDPEMGVDDSEVFGSYRNIKAYLDYVVSPDFKASNIYSGSAMYEETAGQKFVLENTTDASDGGRVNTSTTGYKRCNLTWDMVSKRNVSERPVSAAMWNVIRIANRTLEHLDDITDCTKEEHDELTGYCYFYRAYAHFVLCRKYGGVPYLDKSLGADSEWDIPRLTNWETYMKCAEDFYKAYTYLEKAGWMRRDALPGNDGYLSGNTEQYPSGVKALAFRARTLVYAASPLSNIRGEQDWKDAVEACALALDKALEWKYSLVPFSKYSSLFLGEGPTDESLWVSTIKYSAKSSEMSGFLAFPQTNYNGASGCCPTQNFVDLYETRWGDPLDTPEAREAAVLAGHYDPQDPYSDLDPRFEETIIHDGSTNKYVTGVINIYRDSKGKWPTTTLGGSSTTFGVEWGTLDNTTNGYTNTGYYCKKHWRGQRGDKDGSYGHIDNRFRLAELYLLYAEAVNEVYGPDGTSLYKFNSTQQLTAVQAINKVRARAGMPDVLGQFTQDKESFRKRIQNERMVELAFEGYHYWCDIRRWKTAPERMGTKLMGMYVTECKKDAEHPNGRNYERRMIPESRQCTWKDCMYYFPFAKEQAQTMVKFKNNELWQ